MNLRREATKTIWKTVVFAGAMLGASACGKKNPPAQPTVTEPAGNPDPCAADPCAADPCADDPCGDPCGGRSRGVSDEGDVGRGFILS
ncbi:MAG: hypothetical protein HS111_16625 [Kofleriaceae bacterium]|nr:hypothetical protein [Kofleriaceae bacterium]MCL4228473.1 hypothetical protein [Myxococcales bacterium]